MRESRTYGSVRGAGSNLRPYRDRLARYSHSAAIWGTPVVALMKSQRRRIPRLRENSDVALESRNCILIWEPLRGRATYLSERAAIND
jgi:hypothetical protein